MKIRRGQGKGEPIKDTEGEVGGKTEDRSKIREYWNETPKGSREEVTQSTGKGCALTTGGTRNPLNSRETRKW